MEFMQLEMFVAVVQERTLRQASFRVFRTQPAVSMAIRKLEDEVGVRLFVSARGSPRVLTDAGQTLYDYARKILCLRDETLSALR
jgi:DNA-binding transcriptional LysR family regulator